MVSAKYDHQRERRDTNSGSVTWKRVHNEIDKKFKQFCSVNNDSCQIGPRGPPGLTGPPGPLGPIGPSGKNGSQGAVGPKGLKGDKGDKGSPGQPGVKGDVGSMGSPGIAGSGGSNGDKGQRGLRGMNGPKGECITQPRIAVYPHSQAVFLNEKVILYCWVEGRSPWKITWQKPGGSLSRGVQIGNHMLLIKKVQKSHAGDYICTARSGAFKAISRLEIKEPPKFTKRPPKLAIHDRGTNVSLCCKVKGNPRPKVEWYQPENTSVMIPHPQEFGCLLIDMDRESAQGTDYICRATNSFGMVQEIASVFARSFVAGQSSIIGNNETHIIALNKWLYPVVRSRTSSWVTCWKASKHGWEGSKFHQLCDNKGPTLVIVRVGVYIFGGYAGVSWKRHPKKGYCGRVHSPTSFMFSLVNKPGWGPTKLPQLGYDSPIGFSMMSCDRNGPVFGSGSDLTIVDNAHLGKKSYAHIGMSYSAPKGQSPDSDFTNTFMAGSEYFSPNEVEVLYEKTD